MSLNTRVLSSARLNELGYIGIGTGFYALHMTFVVAKCGELYDGDMACGNIVLQTTSNLKSRHVGHHHVAYYERYVVVAGNLQARCAVGGCEHIEVLAELAGEHFAYISIIINYQQLMAGFGGVTASSSLSAVSVVFDIASGLGAPVSSGRSDSARGSGYFNSKYRAAPTLSSW